MKAEYFPPKVDIILQNEIPTDLYILVSGAVVYHLSLSHSLSLSLSLSLSRFLAFSFYAISYTKSELYLKLQDMLTYKNGMGQVCLSNSTLNKIPIYYSH